LPRVSGERSRNALDTRENMMMPKAPAYAAVLCALAVVTIAGVAVAASVKFPLSGKGVQSGATKIVNRAAPRPPSHGMGTQREIHPSVGRLKGPLRREKQRSFTYVGAWFSHAPSVQEGENWIENAWSAAACDNRALSNVQFNPYSYITYYWSLGPGTQAIPLDYSAKNISGSFTCD
jgi:hypothetical protein